MRRTRSLLIAIAALLLAPVAARAEFDVRSFAITPASLEAGTHPDVTIAMEFAPYDAGAPPERLRDLTLHLPPGLVGNPQATPRCAPAQFEADACPAASRVGTTSVETRVPLLLGLPITAPGDVYNLEPGPGEPGRLGVVVRPPLGAEKLFIASPVRLRPSDAGLDAVITGIPAQIGIPVLGDADVWIESMSLTLFGEAGGEPFMTLPTSCRPATGSLAARSHAGTAVRRSAPAFTPTACGQVPFDPSAGVALEHARRGAPAGYTVSLALPADETPVRQSHVRRAEVVLPAGTTLSPPVAAGLRACSDAQFATARCPADTRIGTVRFATPLLGTLAGTVAFGEPRGSTYRLLVEVDDQGVRLDLVGTVTLDPRTGRITTVFDGLPQVPFTSFALSFRGGERAVLANPTACGSYELAARLTPWSGGAAQTGVAGFDIGGSGAACVPPPFRPTVAAGVDRSAAGRPAGALTIDVVRPDGDQDLRRVTTALPPGLAGGIAGIPLCPEAAARTGACPEASRLGSVSARVGAGDAPVPLSGRVYLSAPTAGGVVGMAIVLPGRVGPVDLGTVVTRADISLRPSDGGLTVRTAALPQMVGGVPVSIRRLTLRLDRSGFIVNASSCAPQVLRATLEGAGGAVAQRSAPYRATDCAGLPFAPRLRATVGARGPRGARTKPALRTVIEVPPGHAATRRAAVTLPRAIGIDAARLASTCTLAQQATGCPDAARVGRGVARSPLLPVPLSGPVYLATLPGHLLPGLLLDLGGPVHLRLPAAVNFDATGTHTLFEGIPDVPLERFELTFEPGAAGVLRLARNVCRGRAPRVEAQLTGHNGAVVELERAIAVTGCRKSRAKVSVSRLRGRRPVLKLRARAPRGGERLRRVRLTLPRGLRAHPARRRGIRAWARGERLPRRAVRLSRRGVLTVRTRPARTVRVTLRRGAFTAAPGLRRRLDERPRLRFRVSTRDRDGRRGRVTVRARPRA